MAWRGAQYEGEFPSLGWQINDWVEAHLKVPNGPRYGEPFVFTDEQLTLLVRIYRLDERGRRVVRRAASRQAKGKGKSPFAAAVALAELAGPVEFAGWDASGEPVGRPSRTPKVQVAATSEDQTGNTYGHVYAMAQDSADDLDLDIGLTRIFRARGQGSLVAVTAAAGSREGDPTTAAILDETHLWLPSNGGVKLAAVIRRNVAKMNGFTFETTNSHVPGQGSVAEATHKASLKGQAGLLYDAVEAPDVPDLSDKRALRKALKVAYGKATWVDVDRIVEEIQDPSTPAHDARRFYLNQIVALPLEEWWLAAVPTAWGECRSTLEIPDGASVAVGVDMSFSHDSTVVAVAADVDGRVVVRPKIWVAPPGGKIDVLSVIDYIRRLPAQYAIKGVAYDPRFFELIAQTLEAERFPMIEVPQSQDRRVAIDGHLFDLVAGRTLAHDGDATFTAHAENAVWKQGERGRILSKGKSLGHIDAVVATGLACWELEREPEAQPEFMVAWV